MSVVKTAVIVVGGTTVLGVGGYALIQWDRSNKLAQELARLVNQAKDVEAKVASNESAISKNEEVVNKLSAQVEKELASLQQLEVRVNSAREELQRAEHLWQKKQEVISELTRERNNINLVLSNLRTLIARDAEKRNSLSRELSEQQRKVVAARELINPLYHPEVRKFLGKV